MDHISDIHVCAGCLATEVQMISMSINHLLEPYQLLSGVQHKGLQLHKMQDKLCWECTALVKKFVNFRRKCETSDLLLQEVFMQHKEMSLAVKAVKLKRSLNNLSSSYSIFTTEIISIEPHKSFKQKKQQKPVQHLETSVEIYSTGNKISKSFSTDNKGNYDLGSFVKVEMDVKDEHYCDSVKDEDFFEDYKSEINSEKQFRSTFINAAHTTSDTTRKLRRTRTDHKDTKSVLNRLTKPTKIEAINFGMIEESLTQEQQHQVIRERSQAEGYSTAQYQCHLCCRSFSKENAYNNHMLVHDPVSGDMECDVCHTRYKTRKQIGKHIAAHHMKRYTCRVCNQVFYNRCMAQKHHAWHNGVTYTCGKCGATFEKRTSHQNHLRLKHSSEHVCGHCAETFVSDKGLKQHYKLMHSRKTSTAASVSAGPYCESCSVQFTSQQAWTRHLHISPKHAHERHLAPLGCDLCGETLTDAASLKKHRSEHRSKTLLGAYKGTITCEQCGAPQADSRAYHAHFRSQHPGDTRTYYPSKYMRSPLMCELCGKVFADKIHLKLHGHTHTGERPYKCTTCGKKFTTPDVLKIHIRSHTKELPYKCDVCCMAFSNGANMKRHKITHSDAKPFPCSTCGKMFKYRSTVKAHIEFVHMKRPWPKRDRSKRAKVADEKSNER